MSCPKIGINKKLTPLKLLSRHGISSPQRKTIQLSHNGKVLNVPFYNKWGLLQGVYSTPKGKVLELRFTPKHTIPFPIVSIDGKKGHIFNFVGTMAQVRGVKGARGGPKQAGAAIMGNYSFKVNPEFRGLGLGEKIYDLGARDIASRKSGRGKAVVRVATPHTDTAAFLKRTGWIGSTAQDVTYLKSLNGAQPSGDLRRDLKAIKFFKKSKFKDPSSWHSIEVINPAGRVETVLVPVKIPLSEQKKAKRILAKHSKIESLQKYKRKVAAALKNKKRIN